MSPCGQPWELSLEEVSVNEEVGVSISILILILILILIVVEVTKELQKENKIKAILNHKL